MSKSGNKSASKATRTTPSARTTAPNSNSGRRRVNPKTTGNRARAKSTGTHRRQTKQAKIEGLLRRSEGATIAQLTKSTGWQAHSIRAALTGLRKKGHEIVRSKGKDGVTRYRLGEEC
jgi:hypothetical protein